jgi:hypothetical protein
MKNIFFPILNLLTLVLLFITIQGCGPGWVTTNNESTTSQTIIYQDQPAYQEYDVNSLNQYGAWTNYNSYGRVWRPSVAPGWQPFTNGHWAHDGYDWVWVSGEPFGGMVYHYGSWEFTPEYGWVWVPENDVWSPACVQWVYYDDEVCWAPRRAQNRNWSDPWDQNNMHPWVAVHMEDFNRDNVGKYRMNDIPRGRNNQQTSIERRQPNINLVRERAKDPNQTYKIGRTQVQRNPVRNNVTPPVERNPHITPPADKNPTDIRPPVDSNPKSITPPVDRNPTDPKPPVFRNPRNVTPPVNRNPRVIKPPVDKNPKTVSPPVDRKKRIDSTKTKIKTNRPDVKAKDNGNEDK